MTRTIATTAQQASRQIRDLLQSVLIAELLDPPEHLWLVSAWITDAAVIDNRGGEFGSLAPSWPEREIVLSEVLAELLAAGTEVIVVTNDDEANRPFAAALRAAAARADAAPRLLAQPSGRLTTDRERGLHRKRLVTPRLVLWGSMNFTRAGIGRNAEDVSLETDPERVAHAVNEMMQLHPARGGR